MITKKRVQIGDKVKVLDIFPDCMAATVAAMYVGKTGIVIGKSGLYKSAFTVSFDEYPGHIADYYNRELEIL